MLPTRVLIVDDEPDLRLLLQRKLTLHKYECFTAANAAQAWTIAARDLPDILLLDLMLSGEHGFLLLRRLKSDPLLRRIRVVIVSATGSEQTRAEAARLGASAFFQKPFDFEQLLQTLQRLLNAPDASAAPPATVPTAPSTEDGGMILP